jgi:hypothetical protein
MEFLEFLLDLITARAVYRESKKAGSWDWGGFWTLLGLIAAMGAVVVYVILGPLPDTHPRVAVGLLVAGGVVFLAGLGVMAKRASKGATARDPD